VAPSGDSDSEVKLDATTLLQRLQQEDDSSSSSSSSSDDVISLTGSQRLTDCSQVQ